MLHIYLAICTLSSPVWLIPPDMLRTFLRTFPHWRGGRTALQVGHLGSKSPSEKKTSPKFLNGYICLKITSKPNGIQWLTRSFSEQKKEDFQTDPHGANMWQPTKVTKKSKNPNHSQVTFRMGSMALEHQLFLCQINDRQEPRSDQWGTPSWHPSTAPNKPPLWNSREFLREQCISLWARFVA